MKVLSIRIDDELALELDAVARVEDEPVSEMIRAALHRLIADLKSDPQFQARLRKILQKDREVIERLAASL